MDLPQELLFRIKDGNAMNGVFWGVTILLGFAQAVFSPLSGGGTVAGHVFYNNGSPVMGAQVEIHYFNAGSIASSPTLTDERGYFSLSAPSLGAAVVSASKVSEGFPNAALALYSRGATPASRTST